MRQTSIAALALLMITAPPTPTAKWVGPSFTPPGGGTGQTTIYYGPWQCRQLWFEDCRTKCAAQGRRSMGCIWLADIKATLHTRFLMMPLSGSNKLAIVHCCCDWEKTQPTDPLRQPWKNGRQAFREKWAKEYGAWPKRQNGDPWEGHHIRDFLHGGDALADNNIFPVDPGAHTAINKAYPECYAGAGPWAQPGPDYPYAE